MQRRVEPEWLDELPPADPAARGSRRDLVRLNAWMGNARTMGQALRSAFNHSQPRRLMELGAGDGQLALQLARLLAGEWKGVTITLLDRQDLLQPGTRNRIEELGWQVELQRMDLFDWLQQPSSELFDALLANLFLHHFSDPELARLFAVSAKRTQAFIAVDPRRSRGTLLFSRLVGFIGCNRVTRHDAPASVRAGFAGRELSQLWPTGAGWCLQERAVGRFGHLFIARRKV